MNNKYKVPVLLYESEEQTMPYVEVGQNEDMPTALFIQEYKHTGEFEPGTDGEEQPIVDIMIHMYVDMDVLKNKLSSELYDQVRVSIGLEPVKKAREKGQKILDKVYDNVNKSMSEVLANKDNIKEELATEFNKKLTDKFFKKDE